MREIGQKMSEKVTIIGGEGEKRVRGYRKRNNKLRWKR